MALSGSLSTNKYSGDIGLKLSWEGIQSIADNTTRIYWTLQSEGGSTGYSWKAGPITVTIAGKTVLSVTSRFDLYGGGRYKKTGNLIVSHNTDGTKSVAMSVKAAIYSSSVNCTGSKSFTLNKIDRYALITSAPTFNDEDNPVIEYTNNAGTDLVQDLCIRMRWYEGETERYTEWQEDLNDGGGTYTFDISTYRNALRQACANSNTLGVFFDLKSTLGGVDYTDTVSSTMRIENADPVIDPDNTLSYSDTSAVAQITGNNQVIVRKKSTLTINVDPSNDNVLPQKYATIGSLGTEAYSVLFNGENYTPDVNGDVDIVAPDITGIFTAVLTVTDSRGNSSNISIDITVFDWQIPSATYTLSRKNGFEDETILTVNAEFSSVDSINVLTITEQHKKKGTSTWSDPAAVTNGTPFSINSSQGGLDKQYEWDVMISVTDKFYAPSSVVYDDIVGRGVPLFYPCFNRNSIGINGFPDADNRFFCALEMKIKPNDTDEGITLPHAYSTTEQIVGYWLDGSPIYEKTIEFQSAVTINANSWSNNVYTNDEDIIVLNGEAYYYDSNSSVYVYWGFMAIQSNTTDKTKINLYNSRDSACQVSILVIRYIKPTQNNS